MDAATLTSCLNAFPASQAVLIRGDHGIGKSQIVQSLAAMKGKNLIDVRASTMQEGDVVGYPDIEKIKTLGMACFALPAWYVRACEEPCILFLDELNRGLVGVLNGMFQVVLDRELGNGPDGKPKRLHPETQVVAAVNWGSDYTVNEMDPALLSRFWVADFKPSVQDWLAWAKVNGINEVLVDFIQNNPNHLRPTKAVEPGKKTPDQRAWDKFNTTLKHMNVDLADCGGNPPALLYPIGMGFVGVEAAASLVDFVKNYQSVITAEDILVNWKKVAAKVKDLPTEKKLSIIEKVKDHCKRNKWNLNQVANLKSFFETLTGECKMSLYNGVLASGNTSNLTSFHGLVKDEIMGVINAAQAVAKKTK